MPQASEFWELGLTPIPVSAANGTGTGEVLDALLSALPPPTSLEPDSSTDAPLAVAIVGRPNVGEGLKAVFGVVGIGREIGLLTATWLQVVAWAKCGCPAVRAAPPISPRCGGCRWPGP